MCRHEYFAAAVIGVTALRCFPARVPRWRHNGSNRKARLHEIIFEADTPAGKAFDIVLLVLIVLSVIAVMLESVASVRAQYGLWLRAFEWIVTILFTIEYVLRLYCVGKPLATPAASSASSISSRSSPPTSA